MKLLFSTLLAALLAAVSPLSAAPVNWTTSSVTAPYDVRTTGALVGSMNVGLPLIRRR